MFTLFNTLSTRSYHHSAYRKFEQWTQEYGPVFSLRQGFENIIVIGRLQAAIDIMEREGASTVDRPRSISAGETLSGGMRTLLTPAGERFKKMRRYSFHSTIPSLTNLTCFFLSFSGHSMHTCSPRSCKATPPCSCAVRDSTFSISWTCRTCTKPTRSGVLSYLFLDHGTRPLD